MNRLAQETSLYLRQHANNPVHWQPWGPQAWQEAKERNVPVLVSIGYSSCHWCHVMEHQVFEKPDLAAPLNAGYVCIKVDREERPDIDMVYMEAVQRMGLGGGWPLNVFCTPDGAPFYGGTYFPPTNWAQVVKEITRAWGQSEADLRDTATQFTAALQDRLATLPPQGQQTDLTHALTKGLQTLLLEADWVHGGLGPAPKFPLPGKYAFLLKTGHLHDKAPLLATLTLRRMAEGGLHDHLAGGFFRYSTDGLWFAPHFEKMLYDNGQLLSALAHAYRHSRLPIYKEALEGILTWLQTQMLSPEGGLYSSIDADSEGEEGRFYTWPKAELDALLGADAEQIGDYFTVTLQGNWEHGRNILASPPDAPWPQAWPAAKEKLYAARQLRIPPTLDTKIIAGWNGLALSGLVHAALFAHMPQALVLARRVGDYTLHNLVKNGRLLHQPDKETEGYLDDYGAVALGLLDLYQATGNSAYLLAAQVLAQRVLAAFADEDHPLFFYASHEAEPLLARKKDTSDSVIPSGNALIAKALLYLGVYFSNPGYTEKAEAMLASRAPALEKGLAFSTTWADLALLLLQGPKEVALVGPQAQAWAAKGLVAYPHVVWAFAEEESQPESLIPAPISTVLFTNITNLSGKHPTPGGTAAWVCVKGTCLPPVYTWAELEANLA